MKMKNPLTSTDLSYLDEVRGEIKRGLRADDVITAVVNRRAQADKPYWVNRLKRLLRMEKEGHLKVRPENALRKRNWQPHSVHSLPPGDR